MDRLNIGKSLNILIFFLQHERIYLENYLLFATTNTTVAKLRQGDDQSHPLEWLLSFLLPLRSRPQRRQWHLSFLSLQVTLIHVLYIFFIIISLL